LFEVVGNAGTPAPAQIVNAFPKLNVGGMFGLTVTVNEALLAHWLPLGVKTYVPELLLSTTAGLQVPLKPFVEVLGSTGTAPPVQMVSDVPNANVGVVLGVTVITLVIGKPHCPAAGVKT
jgi:hypothetical protein